MGTQVPQRRASWHDAYEILQDLWEWTKPGRNGHAWLEEHLNMSAEGLDQGVQGLLTHLYSAEHDKLHNADPIFVSAEMCGLVLAAAASFQPEPLLPSDLMTPSGFLLWETPFTVPDRFDNPTNIHAMSWTPVLGSPERAAHVAEKLLSGRADLLGWFQQRDYAAEWARGDSESAGGIDGIAVTIYATNLRNDPMVEQGPLVVPMHLTPWWFGMSFEGNEVDANGVPTGASWWWKIAQTTLRLMQQRIAHHAAYRPDRPARRQAARRGFEDRDVVVVRLRREKGDRHEESEGQANYSHRFVVNGHWRNAWYPSDQTHRQIWISPYVKGSPDLPLIWRPNRAYNWGR